MRDDENTNLNENKRPTLITVLCILGFIGFPLSVLFLILPLVSPELFQEAGIAVPTSQIIIGLINSLFNLLALIFIWKMKKIGVLIYTILGVVGIAVTIIFFETTILSNIFSIAIFLIFAGLFWSKYKYMT